MSSPTPVDSRSRSTSTRHVMLPSSGGRRATSCKRSPTLVPCGSFSHGCSSSRWAASDCWIRSLPQLTGRQESNRSSPPTSRTSWFSASLRASCRGEAARIPECVGSCDRAVVRTRGVAPPARMSTPCPALAGQPACRTCGAGVPGFPGHGVPGTPYITGVPGSGFRGHHTRVPETPYITHDNN